MNTLELHENFHTTFGQPVQEKGHEITQERAALRLKLAFEELAELATAFGQEKTFSEFCTDFNLISRFNTYELDEVEIADALVDIQVINDGTILETGLQSIFYDLYNQTYTNNMSKAHTTLCECDKTIAHYQEQGLTGMTIKKVGEYYVAYRSDGKILKPYNYVPNDLSNFFVK